MFFVSARFRPILSAKLATTLWVFLCFAMAGAQENSFFVSPGTVVSGLENVSIASKPAVVTANHTKAIVLVDAKQKNTPKTTQATKPASYTKRLEADKDFTKEKKQPSLYNPIPAARSTEADYLIGNSVFAATPSTQPVAKSIAVSTQSNQAVVVAKYAASFGFVYNSPTLQSFCIDFYPNRPPPLA